jgi:hypothetical protein
MASGNVNDLNDSAENIREVFAEISNLVDELNKNLATTVGLTADVTNNLSQSNDKTKESTKQEADKEAIFKRVSSLKRSELKALEEGLKSGKGLNKELAAKLKLEGKSGTLAGTAAMMKARSLGLTKETLKAAREEAKQKAKSNLHDKAKAKLLELNKRVLDEFVNALFEADKQTTQIGKNLNITKAEAIGLKQEFGVFAKNSGDIAVNSTRMVKAMGTLNDQLGTGVRFNNEMLATTSKLTDVVGLSAEAAGSLAFQAQRAGTSVREVEENALGASYEMQRGVGIQLDMKKVLEATGKVSGQLRAQLGANPENIAKAVTAAKLLGAELEDLAAAGKQLLDFESSIESELEAELLTGKQLNLERARAAALAGDQETLAKELAANMGSFSDFTKMNTLQQDALAKSMGMSSDQLSDMLFKQETMGMNAQQLRAQGKDELADRLEALDAQEKMALAQEKLVSMMSDLATIFLPILEGFGLLVEKIMESKIALGLLAGVMGLMAVSAIINAISGIFASFALVPFGLGIPLAIATVAGMMALVASAGSKSQKAKDGFAPSSKGPFTIMDNYGGMATTTPGDNLQVSPNTGAKAAPAPIVIQNNWDAFAASNGNGRKGLGGTQEMQASPTFA